ncbi:MAG: protein kinase, partial [Muribaculaceae bacterium]|nr:protein kinase [Muribaculaceae bacterium]
MEDEEKQDISCNSAMVMNINGRDFDSRMRVADWSEIKFVRTHGAYNLHTAVRYGRKFFIKSLLEKYKFLPEWQRLLFKEFELGSQLDHPGIARTIAWEVIPDIGESLVMEFVDGTELGKWLETDRGLDASERRKVLIRITEAVDYLHSRGISHRDLKPDNILITRKGNLVKIIDFGLGDSDQFVVYKEAAGSVGFGAPEQHIDKIQAAGISSDIYSLGKIIELMFPGRKYRFLVRKCLNTDPALRPSSSDLLRQFRRNGVSPLLIIALTLATVSFLILFYVIWSVKADVNHDISKVVIPERVIDTVFVHKTDTIKIEVPTEPTDAAIRAVWDKAWKDINRQIEFNATFDFPDHRDNETRHHYIEQLVPLWQEHLYYNLLEIGCSEDIANSKSKELDKAIRHYGEELLMKRTDLNRVETDTISIKN